MTAENRVGPAWYATERGGAAQWWTVLHPPYTAWHLAYVVIGASLGPGLDVGRLLATLLAFLLAVGVAAHALDELAGRPLGTTIPGPALTLAALAALGGAVALGLLGVSQVGAGLLGFVVAGCALVLLYNLELFGGLVHNATGFAAAWGAFPVLTGYYAQTGRLATAPILAAVAAAGLSLTQRSLSTAARRTRRRVTAISGAVTFDDGSVEALDRALLLAPLERSLRLLSGTMVVLAAAVAAGHLG